jgi:hypothetical protein
MIGNPHLGTVKLGAILFPSLMGTFDYPPYSNNVRLISVVLDQPRDVIFQVSSFQMIYFKDPWNLPSPSSSMEGIWNCCMAMPLSTVEVAYNIFQQTSTNPDLAPSQELDPVLEPICGQDSLTTQDPLDLVFPSDEVILEKMDCPHRPWDDLHHRSYFLLELRRIEGGEFGLNVNRNIPCPINPMDIN